MWLEEDKELEVLEEKEGECGGNLLAGVGMHVEGGTLRVETALVELVACEF